MRRCFFVSDLHGRPGRYRKLFDAAAQERPAAIFLGGDLFPSGMASLAVAEAAFDDFIRDFLAPGFADLRARLGKAYPRVFLIPGNDDLRSEEAILRALEAEGLWEYIHERKVAWDDFAVFGYACVPPTPFQLKDWERYDVSRYLDPGCVSPEQGWRSVPAPEREIQYATIQKDLEALAGADDLSRAIFLFHTPPYQTLLDRAALDGKMVDHVPLDVHVGSIALRRFIEKRQPRITLHGHIHESARLTGSWKDRIGNTHLFSAAHDGPELALVRFDPEAPEQASRELI
ncbi:MAG: metallophosphoesterase [Calditrichaceae bacterium]|nr:metallophosphoesterase [Calditrichia bacterium]NUQ43414.1 metallophosphoesterase [Calditrichaceae bacterium]